MLLVLVGHGISVESGKDVFLGSNSIYGNSQSGVYINHPKSVTVHNNHITCNLQSGVSTSGQGQVSHDPAQRTDCS